MGLANARRSDKKQSLLNHWKGVGKRLCPHYSLLQLFVWVDNKPVEATFPIPRWNSCVVKQLTGKCFSPAVASNDLLNALRLDGFPSGITTV
jgi:hypothetical protein